MNDGWQTVVGPWATMVIALPAFVNTARATRIVFYISGAGQDYLPLDLAWLVVCLVGWFFGWLIDWLVAWLAAWWVTCLRAKTWATASAILGRNANLMM